MRRHLTRVETLAVLRRGKAVEQFLPAASHDGQPTVRWVSIDPRDGAFVVNLHQVLDPCDPEFLDVTEFPPVDEWEDVGEGVEKGRASDAEEALQEAGTLGAVPERWVNEFVVAQEYRDAQGWT